VLAQAKLTEVIAKLDHNAQSGWKVRNHQSVVLASHRLLSHGHPENIRRKSQFHDAQSFSKQEDDDEEKNVMSDSSDDAPLSVLRTTVLPETMNLTLKSNTVTTLTSPPTSSYFEEEKEEEEEEEEEEEKEEEEEDTSFVPFGLKPKRRSRRGRPKSVRLDKNTLEIAKKEKEQKKKTTTPSGLHSRGRKLNLNVNVRTFIPSKNNRVMSPSEKGRSLLTQALTSPQRKRASLKISHTLRRHVSHVNTSQEVLKTKQKGYGTGLVNNLLGLSQNTTASRQQPLLALGRRQVVKKKVQQRQNERPISLCVYMPVTFSLIREYTWLVRLGRLDRYNAPPPPVEKSSLHHGPMKAKCLKLHSAKSEDDGSLITVETWKNTESGERFTVQEGPGDNLMVELASGNKLLITMESTIEVMANGYSRQRNSDSSEVYSTPWGVRKIYLSNGTIVTTYPDGMCCVTLLHIIISHTHTHTHTHLYIHNFPQVQRHKSIQTDRN
jgi:hypothetical protein